MNSGGWLIDTTVDNVLEGFFCDVKYVNMMVQADKPVKQTTPLGSIEGCGDMGT